MNDNWKKIVLLLLVLTPSFFFLSRAFAGNEARISEEEIVISGPGGISIKMGDIHSVAWVETLPELSGTKGFSLGLIKKGNFIRSSDNIEIRVIKNSGKGFIHMRTEIGEVYLSLGSLSTTEKFFSELKTVVPATN